MLREESVYGKKYLLEITWFNLETNLNALIRSRVYSQLITEISTIIISTRPNINLGLLDWINMPCNAMYTVWGYL